MNSKFFSVLNLRLILGIFGTKHPVVYPNRFKLLTQGDIPIYFYDFF